MGHLTSQIKHPELANDNTLHVIGVIQNSVRYHSRYRLFREWVKHMLGSKNVKLYVVEAVYGDRQPECAPENNEYEYHQVKVTSEIWLKENLINLGVKNLLPNNWKYLAWIDCDITFRDDAWALNCLHQLQHYNILQPWKDSVDLDYYGGIHQHHKSFGYLAATRARKWHGKGKEGYQYAHTGFAWACTRYFYENVGKIADFNIVGAGDHLQAWACIGEVKSTMPEAISDGYKKMCNDWQDKAVRACAKAVGYSHGRIEHHWHGKKENRKYWSRWDILTKNNFNPVTDLAYDSQGVLVLCGSNKYQLEHDIMLYNRQRAEDGEF